jgi:hypothetical protein
MPGDGGFMSFTSSTCRPQAGQAPRPPKAHTFPAHYQAHGRLYRAIVSLPDAMCERDRPLQKRWVFFDCPGNTNPGERLEALLALAWNIEHRHQQLVRSRADLQHHRSPRADRAKRR